jgi:MoaA/NifB/PqqE/SkfB family radical SAM enzyme
MDRLWLSLDGAGPETYEEVRPGASLSGVLENLNEFNRLRRLTTGVRPEMGIVFVAMRRNIGDLPSLVRLGTRVGASRFIVTNVLPHTADMASDILYHLALNERSLAPSRRSPEIRLPNIDVGPDTREALFSLFGRQVNLRLLGSERLRSHDRCPFIEDGAVAVGWDGSLSPCLTLLHDQVSYLDSHTRSSHRYIIGNVGQRNLQDL